jgi:hypothetical protein
MPDEDRPATGRISLHTLRDARERLEQADSVENSSADAQRRDDELSQAREELRRLRDDE